MALAKMLVVDDEIDSIEVIKQGLQQAGFHVDVFSDPLEALRQFKPKQYDMLLLDVRMPNMDGFTLYEKIRQIDNEVKVCFLTAFDIEYQDSFNKRFPNIDSKCYMRKPISIKTLTKLIKDELGLP